MIRWGWLLALAASCATSLQAAPEITAPAKVPASSQPPRRIPTDDFAQQPFLLDPVISPDGTRVLTRFINAGKEQLAIYTVADKQLTLINIPEKNLLLKYRWAGNGRVLISMARPVTLFGAQLLATGLISYDIRTRSVTQIRPANGGIVGDDILYVDPAGEWLLLAFQESIFDSASVSRIDLATGKATRVIDSRDDVDDWYADDKGVVRAGTSTSDRGLSMIYRRTADEKFRKLPRVKSDDEDGTLDLLHFIGGSDEGYMLSNKETGRFGLYHFNYATKQLGEHVFRNDSYDVMDFTTSDDGKAVASVEYADDRDRIMWFDERMKRLQAQIDHALPGKDNRIVSMNSDNTSILIWSGASNDPGAYYDFVPAAHRMFLLARNNERLQPAELSETRYVSYKARDGLEIHAYLTLPTGRAPKGLPLIVFPHGGPYDIRDKLGYDPEVQFFVNRGYVVLQPNFRGSGGYGKDFYAKGEGQWGRAMQDDLDDGMDWLANQDIIDPRRACIVGASYGGYAALWGANRNPERYRCAASYAGISDISKQLKYQTNFRISPRYRKDWRRTVQGAPDFDTRTVSPIASVNSLKVPVLIMHGDADQTVPYEQSKLYADALKKAGKTFEFYTHDKEGHGFSSSTNFKDWLDRLDTFLARYNPS
jgi:dipeptidyl aminopeptidase/acylaminoacyl peptidase